MRKLASIRLIGDVIKHPNADMLDIVSIDGWNCVCKKGEFKKNDPVIYFEVGSYLPVRPEFEFLRAGCYKEHPDLGPGFRIKTIKLRGELSQGLAIPPATLGVNVFPDDMPALVAGVYTDVTEILNVQKYEIPERGGPGVICGSARGNFPDFIRKTDQERVQNLFRSYSERYKDDSWEVTMKLDGSSMTVYVKFERDEKGEIAVDETNRFVFDSGVCSRNRNLKLVKEEYHVPEVIDSFIGSPADVDLSFLEKKNVSKGDFVDFAEETGLLERLEDYCHEHRRSLALQGELMGPRIQKNREKFDQHYFYLFDVFDIDKQQYLDARERMDIFFAITDHARIRHVAVIADSLDVFLEYTHLPDLLAWVDKASLINHNVAEGYVFKNLNHPDVSFKAISNLFLLKHDTEE